jgi:acyl dehydratase
MESKTEAAKTVEGKITDEALSNLKSKVGKKLRSEIGNELACKETITRFVRGVGDTNPLWNDEEYAGKTRYGGLAAPPSWLYSVIGAGAQFGLPGVHGFHSGDDWEFFIPVMLGDRIKSEETFTGFEEKTGDFARRMIIEHRERLYFNQRDELVARARGSVIRVERGSAREKGKYSKIQIPHPWSEEELKKVEKEVLDEKVRGNQVRYWEDVQIGEALPVCVKGPLGVTDEIAFMSGNGGIYLKAHRAALVDYARHPAWAFRDPDTFAFEPMPSVHYSASAARAAGLPQAYAIGVQMSSWVINLITNWMSDEGWLKTCNCEYRNFIFLSDVVWLRGKVVSKYVDENNEYCVDIETSGFNQRGENTMPGKSTVILPSRGVGSYPVVKRIKSNHL